MGESQDSIEFMAKYRDWIAIRKMNIYDNTRPEEVAFHLASIRQTLDKKAFEFLEIGINGIDSYADSVTNGMKGFSGLSEAVQKLDSREARAVLAEATKTKPKHLPIAKAYLLRKVVQNMGFDFDVNQGMLSKIYKDLKVKKPPGRTPKN